MRKKWFKLYHGLPNDPLFAVVAQRAQISRAEAIALWIALMDSASQDAQRGSLKDADLESISLTLGIDIEKIHLALAAWQAKGRIDDKSRMAQWERQQGVSTPRVRAYRARMKEAEERARARAAGINQAAKTAAINLAAKTAAMNQPAKSTPHADSPAAIAARRARLQEMQGRRPDNS